MALRCGEATHHRRRSSGGLKSVAPNRSQPVSSPAQSYSRAQCAVFTSMNDRWGDFSNMASGMPITVIRIHIERSENLYQACRYPHLPRLQQEIIEERNPMTAKLLSKKNYSKSRADWDRKSPGGYQCLEFPE